MADEKGGWFDWLKGNKPKTGTGRNVPDGTKRQAVSRNNGKKIKVVYKNGKER